MGKIINKYDYLKSCDKNKYYLFESGLFYIFLNDDAKYMSEKLGLKITSMGNSIKCGFPIKNKEKYFSLLKEEIYEIIENNDKMPTENKIIDKLKSLDIDNISPVEAFMVLKELKEML